MSADHVVGAIAAYLGAFTAQLLVNRRMRAFVKGHLDGIYRRIGRIEGKMDITPAPFPDTDMGPDGPSGVWASK